MNLKDYLTRKLERDRKKDDVEIVLEALDEISTESSTELSEEFDIEIPSDDSLENVDQYKPKVKKDLFAGYLGELSEAPNPLEYGANATYRNLREGIVYKKGPDNLWEVFVKDGAPGRQGPAAPGGGCGVTEVKNIVENRITTQPIVANYPGSLSNPFANEADRTDWATANLASLLPGRTTAWGPGNVEYRFDGPEATKWSTIIVDLAAAVISGSPSSSDFSGTLTKAAGKLLEISVDVLPEGNFTVSDGTTINFRTSPICASFFTLSIGSNCKIYGNGNKITCDSGLLYVEFLPTAKRSEIIGLDGDNTGTDISSVELTRHFIAFSCDATHRPEACRVIGCRGFNCFSTVQMHAGYRCEVRGCIGYSNSRTILNYSAEECTFADNVSYASEDATMPRVALLNISDVERSFGRGFINNKYKNNLADGWAEEGFSFDAQANIPAKSAFRFASRVAASAAGTVTLATDPGQTYAGYSLIFQTGALAGKRFAISGFSSATATLKAFDADYSLASVGDFCTVEVSCYGNVIEDQVCKSNGDSSGIVFWGFGYGTKVIAPSLDACVVESWQIVDDATLDCTLLPHGVVIRLPTYTNMKAISDPLALSPSNLYGAVFSQHGTWAGPVSDSSENPNLLYLRFCGIDDRGPTHNYFKRVCRLDYKNLKSSDAIFLNGLSYPTFADTSGMFATEAQIALIVGSPRQEIFAPCSGVASGWVRLAWNGSRFVAPSGELLLCEIGTPSAPLYDNVPGVTTLSQLYASSKSIPAYIVPDGQELEVSAAVAVIDTSGSNILLVTLGANAPTETDLNSYPLRYIVTASTNGPGLSPSFKKHLLRVGSSFFGEAAGGAVENGNNTQTYPQRQMTASGPVGAAPLKMHVNATPGLVTTRIKVFALYVRSTGNLL